MAERYTNPLTLISVCLHSSLAFPLIRYVSTCQSAKLPMVPLQGECQAIRSFRGGVCVGRGGIELYSPSPSSNGICPASPRQCRSSQLNTALCKSLKYPPCTAAVVLMATVQKQTKLAASFRPSEPHFLHAAEYGNYVYFFYREIAVEQSSLGKVRQCTSCLGCRTYSSIPASGEKKPGDFL